MKSNILLAVLFLVGQNLAITTDQSDDKEKQELILECKQSISELLSLLSIIESIELYNKTVSPKYNLQSVELSLAKRAVLLIINKSGIFSDDVSLEKMNSFLGNCGILRIKLGLALYASLENETESSCIINYAAKDISKDENQINAFIERLKAEKPELEKNLEELRNASKEAQRNQK